MKGVKMSDFEDITLGPGPEKDKDYIYVGDIGNNWHGHCRGIDNVNMSVYMFIEPNINRFRFAYFHTLCRNKL